MGIDVPVEGAEGKNYTWFDAPIGYISSTKEWALKEKIGNHTGIKKQNWYFIGKDNIVFIA
jgi:methionyl-tRNA synthetase